MSNYKLLYDNNDDTVALIYNDRASRWNYRDLMLNDLAHSFVCDNFWDRFTSAEFLEIWGDSITSGRVELYEFDTQKEIIDYLENLDLILELKK